MMEYFLKESLKNLYTFEEIVILLSDTHPRVDYNTLMVWLRKVMGDHEIAGRIKDIVQLEESDQEKTILIRDLMGERLAQCKNYYFEKAKPAALPVVS